MAAPFAGAPSRTDWLCAALAAQAQVLGQTLAVRQALGAAGDGALFLAPGSLTLPDVYLWATAGLNIVSVTGTTWPWQVLNELLGSLAAAQSPYAGKVGLYFASIVAAQLGQVETLLDDHGAGNSTVCLGYSLGGATTQLMALALAHDGYPVEGSYVFGCPRVGNTTYSAGYSLPLFRLENAADPITVVPPGIWAGPGAFWPVTGPGELVSYQHAGSSELLAADGALSSGESGVLLGQVISSIRNRSAPTHLSASYIARLALQWTGGPDGYPHPERLSDALGLERPATLHFLAYPSDCCS